MHSASEGGERAADVGEIGGRGFLSGAPEVGGSKGSSGPLRPAVFCWAVLGVFFYYHVFVSYI